ncbi:MAG: N-acetylglucosamine-6-phosphate deacetylase [Clostridia bacterium]|nr:N-acetylglucosamine-6-phosphate deacetylase [Clostridia bacterium]
MKYAITNTTIVMTDHLIPGGTIVIEDGRIVDFGKKIDTAGMECYDAGGKYTGPGLMDIHTHAANLIRFHNDPYTPAAYLLEHGVTDVLPATSYSRDGKTLVGDVKRIKEAMRSGKTPNIIGIYMEAPYLNVNFGAGRVNHPWAHTPTLDKFKELVDEAADVTLMWCIAPERENIDEFVDYVRSKNPNARFSVAHSEAEPWMIERFIPKGLCNVTHHTNATGTLQKYPECRTPCVDETVLYNDSIYAELICDKVGIHVDPYILRLTKKIKGDDKIILISDSTDSDGPIPTVGDYSESDDLNFDHEGEISGTKFTIDDACRNMMVHTGASLCQVFKYASTNPATMLGLSDKGKIAKGNVANLVTVDHLFNVEAVWLGGKKVK